MSSTLGTVRENIEAQGFCGLDDKTCTQINYPLRLSPAICMLWAAVGTALASPTILWALAPLAALGAILPGPRLMFSTTMACDKMGTSYIDPVKSKNRKKSFFVKSASYKTALILRTDLLGIPSGIL